MRLIEALIDNGWTLTLWRGDGRFHQQRLHKGETVIQSQTFVDDDINEQFGEIEAEYVREILGHESAPDPAPVNPPPIPKQPIKESRGSYVPPANPLPPPPPATHNY